MKVSQCEACGAVNTSYHESGPIACVYCGELFARPPVATGIEAEVCEDIARRQELGIKKYGCTVADNPLELREWLTHFYQEQLDSVIYAKRAIKELDRIIGNEK